MGHSTAKNCLFLSVIFCLFSAPNTFGQSTENIEQVYQQLGQAYMKMDLSLIESLYAEDAYYLAPNPKQEILQGHEEILANFRNVFGSARIKGSTLRITFSIIDREVAGNMAYDVGYYKIVDTPQGAEPVETAGKFVTVLRRNSDGNWKFVVDAFSNTTLEAVEESEEVQ